MEKKSIVIMGLVPLLVLGVIGIAASWSSDSRQSAASTTPTGFDLVKSRFQVPREMSASASEGRVFAPESVPGYAILEFDWETSNASSNGSCVSIDSDNRAEAGPYCFSSHQIDNCNALISLRRGMGDYLTFGLVRPSVHSVTVEPKGRKNKQVPANRGVFVTLTAKQVESCRL